MAVLVVAAHDGKAVRANVANAVVAASQMGPDVHGYDIELEVEPGKTAVMAFTARATGRFPIEEHKPDARGGHSHGEAPLARIEVYPR